MVRNGLMMIIHIKRKVPPKKKHCGPFCQYNNDYHIYTKLFTCYSKVIERMPWYFYSTNMALPWYHVL